MASKKTSKTPSPQASRKTSSSSSPGNIWPPSKCTPLCFESGMPECPNSGKHHELIMSLVKHVNNSDIEKSDFVKAVEKFIKTKWIRDDCVPEKNEKIRFPLVHWACILGKYKALEYLVSEKGFQLTVNTGKNQEGPLFSVVQYLKSGLNPKCSLDYVSSIFGHIIDVFLKCVPEALAEKETSNDETLFHFCAKRCSFDPCSRAFLRILLLKMKETDKFSKEKEDEILSAVSRKGDTFLHLMVADEDSTETLMYLLGNFGSTSEKMSKAKNNFGKTPRQIAVEKRSFRMLKALGAPDIVIKSLKKAVSTGNAPGQPRVTPTARKSFPQKEKASPKSAAKMSSSHVNGVSSEKDNKNSNTSSNQEKSPAQHTKDTPSGGQQRVTVISVDELEAEGLKKCSCDPPSAEVTKQPHDCNTPTKRSLEPFPLRQPVSSKSSTSTPEKPVVVTENVTADPPEGNVEQPEQMDVDINNVSTPDFPDDNDADSKPPVSADRNVFLSLSNTVNSFSKEGATRISQKRLAPATGRARGPRRKTARMAELSDSESDADEDLALDDDSDDDISDSADEEEEEEGEEVNEEEKEEEEGEEEDLNDEEKEENNAVDDNQQTEEGETDQDIDLEAAPKHTPFCGSNCSSQHHKLLLGLLKCSNFKAAYLDTFMKQVNDYVKFSDVRANGDLPDPVASFKYPLVHWVCVLGKFKVLEKLAAVKEFDLGVQSERTGETGLHRMLLSLDRAMARKKSPTKTILEVFSKTLRTLTEKLPSIITICNKEGDTPFHCLAKVILDCTGELERMNTYEGYFEHLIKELSRLRTSGQLTPEDARELLLKTNNSQETFLHILACRHGVGHRVIKSVLKNIDPEIMTVLKETVNAEGKTPSDLAEDLCSYEMAQILRPRDHEAAEADDNDDVMEELAGDELLQSPERSAPPESPDVNSPPATLFNNLLDGSAARVRLFSVKKEPAEEGPSAEPSRKSPVVLNDSPCPSETLDNAPALPVVKTSPGSASSTLLPAADDEMEVAPSTSANGSRESIPSASTTNYVKASNTPSAAANQNRSNGGDASVISGIPTMPHSEKKNFLNSLHAKFQVELIQAQKGLEEKEGALAQVRKRITDAEERKKKLRQELEETWDEIVKATRDEGVVQAEITAKKRDCDRFKAELTKYEASLKAIRE